MLFQQCKFKRALESINVIIGGSHTEKIGPPSTGIREKFLHDVLAVVSSASKMRISAKAAVGQIQQLCDDLNKQDWLRFGREKLPGDTEETYFQHCWIYNNVRWVMLHVEPSTILHGVHINLAGNNDVDLYKLASELAGRKGYLELRLGQRIITRHKYSEGDTIAAFIELGKALNEDKKPEEAPATVELGQAANAVSAQSAGFYPKATLQRANSDQFLHLWYRHIIESKDVRYSHNVHEATSAEYSMQGYLVLERKCKGVRIEIPIKVLA